MRANKAERGSTQELERWKRAVDRSGVGGQSILKNHYFNIEESPDSVAEEQATGQDTQLFVTRIPGSSIFVNYVVIRCSDVMLVIGNIHPRVVMGIFMTVRLYYKNRLG